MKINEIFKVACEYAPIELSDKLVAAENGYDNSGIIIETDREITKVLATLDLTPQCAEYAAKNGFELIITHHPAIYYPVKSLNLTETKAVTLCAMNGIGVISMHLNLDAAPRGIDYCLANGLGGKKPKILTVLGEDAGYGRMFNIEEITLAEYKNKACEVFDTDNVMIYGDRERAIKKVASFCGAGLGLKELDLAAGADLVVSADIPHHVIREALNRGMAVMQLTHYASENYGMKIFALATAKKLPSVKLAYYGTSEF